MAEQTIEVEKQEVQTQDGTERTRATRCFICRTDIYEDGDQMVIVADVPGVDESALDITLEKNVLTINAYVEPAIPEGYAPVFAEYEVGDYQRSFKISDEIDRERIEATVKDGVLRVYLPKAAPHSRKISVKGS